MASIFTKGRSSTPERKQWKERTTMGSRYSGSILNGTHILRITREKCSPETCCSTLCSAEITFKTDPKNTDYSAEHGASRNFEPWREEKAVEEEDRLAKLEEEENNPMKALENRTVDSKREMDRLDALQDMRARNARNERLAQSLDLLATLEKGEIETEEDVRKRQEEEDDEKTVQVVFSKVTLPGSETTLTVKRKAEGEEPRLSSLLSDSTRAVVSSNLAGNHVQKKRKQFSGIKLKKKP